MLRQLVGFPDEELTPRRRPLARIVTPSPGHSRASPSSLTTGQASAGLFVARHFLPHSGTMGNCAPTGHVAPATPHSGHAHDPLPPVLPSRVVFVGLCRVFVRTATTREKRREAALSHGLWNIEIRGIIRAA